MCSSDLVALFGELEIKQARDHAVRAAILIDPLRVGFRHGHKDLAADEHKSSGDALPTNKAHAVHRKFAVFVVVEVSDVDLVFATRARDTSDDALLGVITPRHQAEDMLGFEIDVTVDEEQVVAIGLKHIFGK